MFISFIFLVLKAFLLQRLALFVEDLLFMASLLPLFTVFISEGGPIIFLLLVCSIFTFVNQMNVLVFQYNFC